MEKLIRMMKSDKLIVFAIDEHYSPHLAVALMSLIRHNEPAEVSIAIIHKNIKSPNLKTIIDFFSARGLSVLTRKVDSFLADISVGYHFNEVIFYRLLAPELFPYYAKILYLDSDIVFADTILELFDTRMESSALAAVEKTSFSGVPTHLSNYIDRYLASGLLLMDTRKFVDQAIKEKCMEFLRNYHYEMPDQDALSFVVRDFVAIDPSYSVETAFLNQEAPEYHFAKNPKIIQFSGSSKPWHMNNNHPYKKLYWDYRNQTPYKSFLPDDFSVANVARYIAPNAVKSFIKKIIGIKPE